MNEKSSFSVESVISQPLLKQGMRDSNPCTAFYYRRNSFHVHAKHRINTGFFTFSITPKMKHLHHYATRCNTKCNTKMIQYSLPDCQSGRIFLLFYPEFLSYINLVWICNTVHLCDFLVSSSILSSNTR